MVELMIKNFFFFNLKKTMRVKKRGICKSNQFQILKTNQLITMYASNMIAQCINPRLFLYSP